MSVTESVIAEGNASIVLRLRLRLKAQRLIGVDVEASIGMGFTPWRNASTDFHRFKVRDRKVQAVHALLARATTSEWN